MEKVMGFLLLSLFLMLVSCAQQSNLEENSEEDESANLSTEHVEGYDQEEELSVEERHWKRVFAKAFETVDCPESRDPSSLPEGYYKGPMIDTHIHLQNLPGGAPGFPDDYYTEDNLGIKRSMDEWVCMINVEGTKQVWGFFPVAEPIVKESVGVVEITVENYPNLFVHFVNPPGRVDARGAASLRGGLIKGTKRLGYFSKVISTTP